MIEGLKPYPAYKHSGVPWLGNVPEHWDVTRFKRVARLDPSKSEATSLLATDTLVTFLPMEKVFADGRIDASDMRQIGTVWSGFTYFKRGDVLVAKITPCFENGKGACLTDLPTEIGFGSTEFIVLRAGADISPDFVYRITTLPDLRRLGVLSMYGAAGQQRVPAEFIANFTVAVPSCAEQAAITRFLDNADRRIRRYIAAKRRLIGLLNEQKQAIIHRAVTRGLDPHVRLKPSGIPWLGDVPKHWEIIRLKTVAHVQTGITLGKRYEAVSLIERPYLRVANVQTGRLDLCTVKTIAVPLSEIGGCELRSGDVLMTEGGDIDKLGRGCVWSGELEGCLHQNHIFAVRPNQSRLLPDYLLLLMASRHGRSYFEITAKRTTNLASTNSTTLGAFPLMLPNVAEQQRLTNAVAEETRSLNSLIACAEREIALIREYRTRLIADVVTGKLDVRAAAAALPDELAADELDADEAEPFGEIVEEEDDADAEMAATTDDAMA